MTLNAFVDKIYCINLDRRPDRWARCQEVFKQHDLNVQRVPAIDGKTLNGGKLPLGALGVLRSNFAVIGGAKRANMGSICIFEDDIELDDDFNKKFDEFIGQVPSDWAFIYLGASNKRPSTRVSKNVKRLAKAYGAYAIIIRNFMYDQTMQELVKEDKQVDFTYAQLQARFPSYIADPFLAWVRNDYSDINDKFINVSRLKQDNAK